MPRARKERVTRQSGGNPVNPTNTSTSSQMAALPTATGLRAQLDAKQVELDALQADLEEFRQARLAEHKQAELRIAAAEEERDTAEEERNAAEQQLAAIPVTPTPPLIAPQAPVVSHVGLPCGNDLLAGCVNNGNKVMKPKGSAGKDWNLRDQMGLSKYKEQYKAIHRTVLRLVAYAHLDSSIEYKRQDALLIAAICRSAVEEHPFLSRFILPATWPVLEMIKVLLRNQRAYIVVQGGHHSVLDLPIQNLSFGGGSASNGNDNDF